jgi:hypothetical protein
MRALPLLGRFVVVGGLLTVLVGVTACTARTHCAKRAQCLSEEQDVDLQSDSVDVCVAEYDGYIAALRANEEPECQALADAQVAFDLCRASLDCNDYFDDNNVKDACKDQLDDLQDAFNDVSGDECSAIES